MKIVAKDKFLLSTSISLNLKSIWQAQMGFFVTELEHKIALVKTKICPNN